MRSLHVVSSVVNTVPLASLSQLELLIVSGGVFQSPAITQGPPRVRASAAASWRTLKLYSESPSLSFKYTEMMWRPPATTALTWAATMRCLRSLSMSSSSTGVTPVPFLARTAQPPEPLSASVVLAGVLCEFQPRFLRRAFAASTVA